MRLQNYIVYLAANGLRKLGHNFDERQNEKVIEMQRIMRGLEDKSIDFAVEQYPDGSWSAESRNIDGIMTGSADITELPDLIKDAIFTYFEIPPQLCNPVLLRSDNEPVTVQQKIHVGA